MRGIPEIAELMKLKRPALKDLCQQFGLSQSHRKSILSIQIIDHLKIASKVKLPFSVMAIDVGCVNLAYAHLKISKSKIKILHLSLFNPDMPVVHNMNAFAVQTRKIVDLLYKPKTIYCIERQSVSKSGINSQTPFQMIRNTLMEALLVGLILERGGTVVSILPIKVSTHFDLASTSDGYDYNKKKKEGVRVAEDLLVNDSRFECSDKLRDLFMGAAKKDDLSDALLIGTTYADWILEAHKYIDSR